MKTNSILGGVVLMTAAFLAMIACNTIDVQMDDETVDAVKTIPYTVQVGAGDPSTRATVLDDYQTLHFAEGDKLYITGTNIKGVLNIQTGAETASATFSGNLTYSGEGSPADNLELTATLVSAQQVVGNQVSVDGNGAVTVNYPYHLNETNLGDFNNPYCTSVNDAVQKYSRLTGTSTFSAKSFTLTQQTAFLNFEITFMDGTRADTKLNAGVLSSILTNYFDITTKTESEKVVAKFVLPVAGGTTIDFLMVKLGDDDHSFYIENMTFTGKVYNVKRTFFPLSISNPKLWDVIGSDGKNYSGNLPSGVTAVAKICYVSANYGLALAMSDESSKMDWNTATMKAAAHTPTFTHSYWTLPTQAQWNDMFDAAGSSMDLSKKFETGLENGGYWSSTESSDKNSVRYYINLNSPYSGYINGVYVNNITGWWIDATKDGAQNVRACLVFSRL